LGVSKLRNAVTLSDEEEPHVMKLPNGRRQSEIGTCLALIAMFSSASKAQPQLVEESVEAEVRSSGGIEVSSAAVGIPRECHYLDHEIQFLNEEPPGTFRTRTTGNSTSFNVTIGRDQHSQSERIVVLVVVAFKYSASGPNLYLKARLLVHMSCDSDNSGQSEYGRI
jgi:hypothetical protein